MSGHFKRPVVSETYLNPVIYCAPCSGLSSPVSNTSKNAHRLSAPTLSSVSPRAAAMTLRTVLLSLQALLAAAEPDDPQDAVVANQVRKKDVCVGFDTVIKAVSYIHMANNIFSKKVKHKSTTRELYFGNNVLCLFLSRLSLFADVFIY